MARGHISNSGIFGVGLASLGLLVVAHFLFSTVRGAVVVPFGESTGRIPQKAEYYGQAAEALGAYLRSRGFHPTLKPPDAPDPAFGFRAQKDTWYEGEQRLWHGIRVSVRLPTENAAGIHVEVSWFARGYPWYLDRLESQAKALTADLAAWWDQYRKDHPEETGRSGF